jgi:hypothetical protein
MTESSFSPPDDLLPYGAHQLEIGDFLLIITPRGKLVFVNKKRPHLHLTLHPGHGSGIIDVHLTRRSANGRKQHRPLCAIEQRRLGVLFAGVARDVLGELFRLYRPLRIGWLRHRSIGIRTAPWYSQGGFERLGFLRGKDRFIVTPDRIVEQIVVPEYLDDIYEMPDGAFDLLRSRRGRIRQVGIAFKVTSPAGDGHLFWIKMRDLYRFADKGERVLKEGFRRFALQREEHARRLRELKLRSTGRTTPRS